MNLVTIGDVILPAQVALTELEHETGLKNVRSAPVMAFVFSKPEVRYFWMKDTYVPLDIIFCAEGRVLDVAQGVPMSEKLIGLPIQSDLVIEMPRGSAEHLGIVAGQSVEIQLDSVSMAKRLKLKMPHLG
jgi:uncharacterized membrane protein (UPF0127 family)